MQLTEEQMRQLCHVVMDTVIEKGMKGTTMDLVAARLRISKRTLYEIFDNKLDMLTTAIDVLSKEHTGLLAQAVQDADNILEGVLRAFDLHRQFIAQLNVNFFKDMDRLYQKVRHEYDKKRNQRLKEINNLFISGIQAGYFRDDLNYHILYGTLELQMESLKRMEEIFPPDTSLVDIYHTITTTFLRGIVSAKGREILERHLATTKENK